MPGHFSGVGWASALTPHRAASGCAAFAFPPRATPVGRTRGHPPLTARRIAPAGDSCGDSCGCDGLPDCLSFWALEARSALPKPQGGPVAERRLRIAHERGRSEVDRMPSARDGTHFNRPGLARFSGGAGKVRGLYVSTGLRDSKHYWRALRSPRVYRSPLRAPPRVYGSATRDPAGVYYL